MNENDAKPTVTAVGFGPWLIAGTPVTEPYPCRCHESRFGRCSPVFCPCAGRPDVQPDPCCSGRVGPVEVVIAKAAYDLKKRQERGLLG